MRRRGVAAAHLCRCFCPDACVTLSVQYCRSLEEGSFRGRTADFFWLIFLGATSLTLIAPIAGLSFLGGSLTFMMVYIWARRNPFGSQPKPAARTLHQLEELEPTRTRQTTLSSLSLVSLLLSVRMNFLGLFTFSAPYLPWVLLSFSFLLGNNPMVDLLGILVGHSYYFLEDVYPRMLPSRRRLIATPRIVKWMFAPNVAPPPGADAMPRVEFEQERIIAQQIAQQQAAEQNGGLADQQPPPEEREEGIILAE